MRKFKEDVLIDTINSIFETMYSLESIIKLTLTSCSNKEIYSIHYNLPSSDKKTLSEERNNYINMLNLALEQVNNLKELNLNIEKEITLLK